MVYVLEELIISLKYKVMDLQDIISQQAFELKKKLKHTYLKII